MAIRERPPNPFSNDIQKNPRESMAIALKSRKEFQVPKESKGCGKSKNWMRNNGRKKTSKSKRLWKEKAKEKVDEYKKVRC